MAPGKYRLLRPFRVRISTERRGTDGWSLWRVPASEKLAPDVIVARRLDEAVLTKLEAGAKVLLLPDGGPGSPPLQSHWFLRGGPAVLDHPALKNVQRELLIDTQHFDMAGDVIPNITYIEEIDPIFLLWETTTSAEVGRTPWRSPPASARVAASSRPEARRGNERGRQVAPASSKYLVDGPDPRNALSPATITGIRQKLTEQKVELGQKTWKFKPDPKNDGLKQNWHDALRRPPIGPTSRSTSTGKVRAT